MITAEKIEGLKLGYGDMPVYDHGIVTVVHPTEMAERKNVVNLEAHRKARQELGEFVIQTDPELTVGPNNSASNM